MPLEHDDCFDIKAEDSIDELMNWFSQGKRIAAIRNADSGVVTHLISRRALLSFLHSNLKSDWFPTLLTSEVIPLYMIVPRYVIFFFCDACGLPCCQRDEWWCTRLNGQQL